MSGGLVFLLSTGWLQLLTHRSQNNEIKERVKHHRE
jgi:hypothetical protein